MKRDSKFDALAEKIINRALRRSAAERAETQHAMDSSSPVRKTMRRRSTSALPAALDNKLFQRGPGDPGYREPSRASFAFDGDGPRDAVRQVGRKIRNHLVAVRDGESELDVDRLLDYSRELNAALEVLEMGGEDEASEEERDREAAQRIPSEGPSAGEDEEESEPRYVGGGSRGYPESRRAGGRSGGRGTSGVGEPPARSAVTAEGRRRTPDHRKDFNSIAQGGADSAMTGYDPETLFQK